MERRELLRSAALAMTAAWLPPMIRRAFAAADECDEHSALLVRAALDRARARGLPMLVLVVPSSSELQTERAFLFGELIDLGSDITLGTLALAEVVCAKVEAVHCIAPATPREPIESPPMFLLVDTATSDPAVSSLHVTIPPWSERAFRTDAEELASWKREVHRHVARMTIVLRRALAGTDLMRRARQNFQALATDDRARILAAPYDGGAALPLDLVEAGAPLLLASVLATHDGDARRRVLTRLGAAGRRRWREHAPGGARWNQFACDTCGLGSVATMTRRFLDFYAAREP